MRNNGEQEFHLDALQESDMGATGHLDALQESDMGGVGQEAHAAAVGQAEPTPL